MRKGLIVEYTLILAIIVLETICLIPYKANECSVYRWRICSNDYDYTTKEKTETAYRWIRVGYTNYTDEFDCNAGLGWWCWSFKTPHKTNFWHGKYWDDSSWYNEIKAGSLGKRKCDEISLKFMEENHNAHYGAVPTAKGCR